jgi:hypothetical protein
MFDLGFLSCWILSLHQVLRSSKVGKTFAASVPARGRESVEQKQLDKKWLESGQAPERISQRSSS